VDSINLTKEAIQPFADTFEFAKDEHQAHTLWSARKEALWSMIALGDEGSSVWTTDVAVPISSSREIIGEWKVVAFSSGTKVNGTNKYRNVKERD
jgi:D-lactate dehydrogenase (cytochrome)